MLTEKARQMPYANEFMKYLTKLGKAEPQQQKDLLHRVQELSCYIQRDYPQDYDGFKQILDNYEWFMEVKEHIKQACLAVL